MKYCPIPNIFKSCFCFLKGLDVKSLGRIFVGLAQSGAWGCFDEFNRLDEDTLSTVATLVEAIQQALKNKDEKVNLLGSQVLFVFLSCSTGFHLLIKFPNVNNFTQTDINPDAGIFITLNPAGKEYGGRQKLPDNLKLLFRPVVMAEPVRTVIYHAFTIKYHVLKIIMQ